MKTHLFLILSLALNALASDPSVRVERGIGIVKTWIDGFQISEFRQVLSSFTNLLQVENYWQEEGDWERKLLVSRYRGVSPMMLVDGYTVEWRNGIACTNLMDPYSGAWSTFNTGGSQGAMCVQNGNERTQIINCSVLHCEWKTNGFQSSCEFKDDQSTMILWFRTNSAMSQLPWFIGSSCSLEPGKSKDISISTPLDVIWRFMGTDKCFKCGESCWLAGWPRPEAQGTTSASTQGSSLHLSFSGAPGVSYALQGSFNLRDWAVLQVVEADSEGGVDYQMPDPAGPRFFRFEAVQTATMNEQETRDAIREIKAFSQP